MVRRLATLRGRWVDSVLLMRLARDLEQVPGVSQAAAVMATDANRRMLADLGWPAADLAEAGSNDLVVAVAGEAPALEAVLRGLENRLAAGRGEPAADHARTPEPRSIAEAASRAPDAGLAVISVPGGFAAREARAALSAGLNVFLFSSNVSIEDELALKRDASRRGLLVMGPDCGTSIVSGVGVGFANAVRRGPIAAIGPSGTGLQEFTCLVHRWGSGISHAIGTGSRDLSDAIGGITTFAALDALEADAATSVVAVVGKPPGESTLARLRERLARLAKPSVLCLLGAATGDTGGAGPVRLVSTVDEAAAAALVLAGGAAPPPLPDLATLRTQATSEAGRMAAGQRYLRGLFAGGTFCSQAQSIMRDGGLAVHAQAPLPGMPPLLDPRRSVEHTLVDLGAEEFVLGRPHPMIDASQRTARILVESRDPSVAVLLIDVILGSIASPTPAQDLADAIRQGVAAARARGGHLCVAASVCGTDQDRQSLARQVKVLEAAGALVFPSAAQAALFARELALLRAGG